jgi:DNA-binding transcriptional ArsR family regulator
MDQPPPVLGDADLSVIGAVLSDAARCRMLLALDDGRALPASRLASEAGVTPATASSHLRKLLEAGLLDVEAYGRFRYYRLAGQHVGALIEALHRFSPRTPVRSLKQGTRAAALRDARTCYDHLAGRLGVGLMAAMLAKGHVDGGDGRFDPASGDPRAGYGHEVDYVLTRSGNQFLDQLGVVIPAGRGSVLYCVDWTEQRHHLSGPVGRGILFRLLDLDWVRRGSTSRAVHITAAGRDGFTETFGSDVISSPAG